MDLRDIPGQPGYQCNAAGEIFSLKSGVINKMTLFVRRRGGYLGVNLTHSGVCRLHSVHVLIANTWIGPAPSKGHLVMHGDNDTSNNSKDNLKWGLPVENSAQMVKEGRSARGERVHGAKLKPADVLAIRERIYAGELPAHIAQEMRMGETTIRDIGNRKIWRHI